jgi:uncharacterized Fe-S cluster protein YjdI
MDRIVKRYTRDGLTVVWQPDKCIHSAVCFRGLPEVFAPWKRPWVDMNGADLERIDAQVARCPSGALSIERAATAAAADGPAVPTEPAAGAATEPAFRDCVRVELQENGPILLHGEVAIREPGGRIHHRDGTTALCRCGGSGNKPFCDGTHKRNGFQS